MGALADKSITSDGRTDGPDRLARMALLARVSANHQLGMKFENPKFEKDDDDRPFLE